MFLTEFILHKKGLIGNFWDLETSKDKQGVVFVFPQKQALNGSHGQIVRSFNGLAKTEGSHWTPNVFAWGKRQLNSVSGFEEKNLNAINTFVIDLDFPIGKKADLEHVINLCIIVLQALPTLIVSTPRGYQLYLVLDNPSYISSANNFKSLYTAKCISKNLRQAFYEEESATDTGCNHFGIFRKPTENNTIFFDERFTFSFAELMKWSIKYGKKAAKKQKSGHKPTNTNRNKNFPQVKEPWFDQLLHANNIDSDSGLGRNNTILTLSLACKQSNYDQDQTYNLMDEFNSRLLNPLVDREVKRIVNSAYQHGYTGASKEYIQILTETWLGAEPQFKTNHHWYKFKKARQERRYSHDEEWVVDLKHYLTENINYHKGYLKTTWKDIRSALNIPQTTLKRIVKKLREQDIFLETKRGRGGYIKITTSTILLSASSHNKNLYKRLLVEFYKAARFILVAFKNENAQGAVMRATNELSAGLVEPLSFSTYGGAATLANCAGPSG